VNICVITLRYSEGLQGFPEDDLAKVVSGSEVLEVRDHFFMHGNVPHLALVLLLGGDNMKPAAKRLPTSPSGLAVGRPSGVGMSGPSASPYNRRTSRSNAARVTGCTVRSNAMDSTRSYTKFAM